MDSSSEGSFAWTDASDDSTDSENMAKINSHAAQSGEESESGKNYKKKLQKQLFGSEEGVETPPARVSKRKADHSDAVHSKRIKLEPESDAEYSKKKKKKTSTSNDHYEESFLDSKVKNEESFVVPSAVKVKKNKKKRILSTSDNIPTHNGLDDTLGSNVVLDYENETSAQNTFEDSALTASSIGEQDDSECHLRKTKKKKKKKSHHRSPGMEVESQVEDTKVTATEEQQPSDSEELESSLTVSHVGSGSTKDKPIIAVNGDHTPSTTERRQSESLFEKRKPRMSERIQFEEDEESEVSIKSPNTSTMLMGGDNPKLEAYIKYNPALCRKQLPSTTTITADDDVWVLHCPHDVTAEDFREKRWTLDGKCKIKLAGNTYEGNIQDTHKDIILCNAITDGNVMTKVSVSGCIRLHRKLRKVHVQEDTVMVNNRTDFIPLPTTKCRHPLLGPHYKKALKLPEAVAERLNAVPAEPEPLLTVKKKKKKRKHSECAAEKHTKRPVSLEAWDSEKAIEQNLFNF